jgi:hypothetical protein
LCNATKIDLTGVGVGATLVLCDAAMLSLYKGRAAPGMDTQDCEICVLLYCGAAVDVKHYDRKFYVYSLPLPQRGEPWLAMSI